MGIQIPYNGNWIDISASSADKLTLARTFVFSGDVTGSVIFDGTANVSVPLSVINSVKASQDSDGNVIKNTYLKLTGGTINGNLSLIKDGDASIELGRIDGTSSTPYIDFHAGQTATDYDVRIKATVGTGVTGAGTLSITAGNTVFSGTITGNVTGTASNTSAIAGISTYTGTTNPSGTTRVNIDGYVYATKVFNAVYNDYAECFKTDDLTYDEAKNKIVEINNRGNLILASENSTRVIGIVSDQYGFLLGGTITDIENNTKLPVGLAGTLWVYSSDHVNDNDIGQFICSANNGLAKISILNEKGTIVGKIIDIDKVNNRYKVIITLS